MAYTTINKSSEHFSTNLWVADDTSPRSLTNFGHQPDFVWVKHRGSANTYHTLVDSVRGGDKILASNVNAVEDTKSHGEITSFNSDGITVADGTSGTYPKLYFNDLNPFGADGGNYVGWSWKANGTGSANTDGTISSTVSANTTSGFSIVSYTGDGSASATVGHGLSVAPKMIIIKRRNASDTWYVMHTSLSSNYNVFLNNTEPQYNVSTYTGGLISTSPTSSVFSFVNGSSVNNVNASGGTYIAYCFAEKTGYSKFGSYVGNGNADGTFIYTGFKPAFVMWKNTTSAGYYWHTMDNKREPNNPAGLNLFPNLSNAENDYGDTCDFVSNGFKFRTGSSGLNTNGQVYIYMAFAEAPLVGTNNVPCTAR